MIFVCARLAATCAMKSAKGQSVFMTWSRTRSLTGSRIWISDDIGALWENFCVAERMKANQQKGISCSTYFWRNHAGKEVDYLEESNGRITAFEYKWAKEKYRAPEEFLREYKVAEVKLINKDSLFDFV